MYTVSHHSSTSSQDAGRYLGHAKEYVYDESHESDVFHLACFLPLCVFCSCH